MKKSVILILIAVLVVAALGGAIAAFASRSGTKARGSGPQTKLGKFDSAADFIEAFKNGQMRGEAEDGQVTMSAQPATSGAVSKEAAPEHSSTNVQVEGVDEADIVKNDGKYIYAIAGDSVFVVLAYPAEDAKVLAKIDFDGQNHGEMLSELFIDGDRLAVIGSSGGYYGPTDEIGGDVIYPRGGTTFVKVYDVSDRSEPKLVRTIEYEGSYSTARMIDGNVHVVLTTSPYYVLYDRKNIAPEDIIPRLRDSQGSGAGEAFEPAADYREIDVVDPERFTSFLSVVSFSMKGGAKNLNKRVIAGYSDDVYASLENLYVASTDYRYWEFGPGPEGDSDEKTTIYKFRFDGPNTKFVASGEVPGTILNQFSMDESKGFFRIATTRGHVSREVATSTNNVYILAPDMKVAGSLEGLARGERIYSVRFMGDRGYMVTFKKVDPLFVLDLSNPSAPAVLGELKIPGYSDYLHPYDENHVIGVGKNTVEAAPEEGGNFAWYQGMKIAIFDVTDVANPKEMHKVEIGDRGTDSYALNDHKAFLFDREKNLLVLPVALAELTPEQKASPSYRPNDYGQFTFQGAYVYDVSLESGFRLKGRVTHSDNPGEIGNSYGYYGSDDSVQRSLYIGSNLYTVSQAKIRVNRLDDLTDVATVRFQ